MEKLTCIRKAKSAVRKFCVVGDEKKFPKIIYIIHGAVVLGGDATCAARLSALLRDETRGRLEEVSFTGLEQIGFDLVTSSNLIYLQIDTHVDLSEINFPALERVTGNILIYDNLRSELEFQSFEKDMRDEFSKYGDIEELLV